jgi:hypothetical protein
MIPSPRPACPLCPVVPVPLSLSHPVLSCHLTAPIFHHPSSPVPSPSTARKPRSMRHEGRPQSRNGSRSGGKKQKKNPKIRKSNIKNKNIPDRREKKKTTKLEQVRLPHSATTLSRQCSLRLVIIIPLPDSTRPPLPIHHRPSPSPSPARLPRQTQAASGSDLSLVRPATPEDISRRERSREGKGRNNGAGGGKNTGVGGVTEMQNDRACVSRAECWREALPLCEGSVRGVKWKGRGAGLVSAGDCRGDGYNSDG